MDTEPITVLIAEDSIELGLAVELTLKQAGFSTQRVSTGKEVLDFCATHSPDTTLLLLDYQLGDLTAKEVIQRLKKQNRCYYFIVMTGHGNESIAVDMMKLGAEEYLVKDADTVDVLVPLLSQVIEGIGVKQSLKQTQRILDTAHQAIMAANNGIAIADLSSSDCPVTYFNPAFATITGYPCSCRPTLKGWLDSCGPQQPGVRILQAALRHHKTIQAQLNLKPNSFKVNLCFTPETPEQQGSFIAIVTDMTQEHLRDQEISQLRRQLESMQHLAIAGQIANELAHEIGQPLTHVCSIIQSLTSKYPAASKEYSVILTQIDRITNLLRSFSADESERCSPIKLPIASILDSALQLCQCGDGIYVSADIPEDLPEITVDRAKIIQILLNLITNAKEACGQEGTIHLSSSVRTAADTGKRYAAISVQDNGCGIEPENLPKLFNTFYSTKSKSRSRGLGLSICQAIAVQHGGWIDVQSQPGQGSCFTLLLPLDAVEASAAASETDIKLDLRTE
jgi:signal transduction histidine kinase/ActR/RegA family two-component response regulator